MRTLTHLDLPLTPGGPTLRDAREALDAGIATVYQDLAMIPLMAIWRNFFLGAEPTRGRGPFRRFDAAQAKEVTRRELSAMGIDIRDPDRIREIAYFNPPAQTGKNLQLPNSTHAMLGSIVAPPVMGTLSIARSILQGESPVGGLLNDQSRLLGADLSADWCMSPPEFRGNDLMVSCMDNGFMRLRIDPTVYPPR